MSCVVEAGRYWKRRIFGQLTYYGLNEIDRKLEAFLPSVGGVFIEAGANDGVIYSNTAFFERNKGWSGLLIEPIPEQAEACMHNRPGSRVIQAALGAPDQLGQLLPMTWCNFMSIVEGAMGSPEADAEYIALGRPHLEAKQPYTVHVPVTTLSTLIDRFLARPVDLLSLDVEGYEMQALEGLDLTRHRPRMILVECLFREDQIRARLAPYYDFVDDLGEKNLLFKLRK